MKADEIARYLPYAPKNVEFKLITAEQYYALLNIAQKFSVIYNEIRNKRIEAGSELAIIKEMVSIHDDCIKNI